MYGYSLCLDVCDCVWVGGGGNIAIYQDYNKLNLAVPNPQFKTLFCYFRRSKKAILIDQALKEAPHLWPSLQSDTIAPWWKGMSGLLWSNINLVLFWTFAIHWGIGKCQNTLHCSFWLFNWENRFAESKTLINKKSMVYTVLFWSSVGLLCFDTCVYRTTYHRSHTDTYAHKIHDHQKTNLSGHTATHVGWVCTLMGWISYWCTWLRKENNDLNHNLSCSDWSSLSIGKFLLQSKIGKRWKIYSLKEMKN